MFEEEMRAEYQVKVKSYLMERTWYKLVDCLEEVTNFWSFGRDFTTMPTYNTYMPTRNHVLDKPDMLDGENDDLGYRFKVNRLSPTQYLNTLKGYKMLPKPAERPRIDHDKHRFYKNYRRLSRPRMQGFSTVNTFSPNQDTRLPRAQTFLQGILS
jgi:hypothetical protein